MTGLKSIKLLACALICAAITACVPTTESIADDVSRSTDKVILVGAFQITPTIPQSLNTPRPISRGIEVPIFGTAEELVGNRLVTGFLPLGTQVRPSIFSGPLAGTTHSVPLDELYFIEVDRTAIELQPSQYFLSDMGVDSIRLPGNLATATHPTAQIVYVGTVRYTRDDFFAITDVRVSDRFAQAAAAARARYGSDVTIAKSLWRPTR